MTIERSLPKFMPALLLPLLLPAIKFPLRLRMMILMPVRVEIVITQHFLPLRYLVINQLPVIFKRKFGVVVYMQMDFGV